MLRMMTSLSQDDQTLRKDYEKVKQLISFSKASSSPRDIYNLEEDKLPQLIESARSKLNNKWQPNELQKKKEEKKIKQDLKLTNLTSSQRSDSPYFSGDNSPLRNGITITKSKALDSLSNNNSLGKNSVHEQSPLCPEHDMNNTKLQKLIK